MVIRLEAEIHWEKVVSITGRTQSWNEMRPRALESESVMHWAFIPISDPCPPFET